MITAQSPTPHQARPIQNRIDPTVRYICRLYERMNAAGCPGDDTFRIAVERAYDAMRHLSTELYYAGCRTGVGRPPKPG